MADTREIVVRIIGEDGGGVNPQPSPNPSPSPDSPNPDKMISPTNAKNDHLLGKSVLLNQAFEVAKTALMRSIDFNVTRYLDLKEDYIGENNYQIAKNNISMATNFASGIIVGAMAGAKLGVYGAVAGGVIGAIGGTITNVQSYRQLESTTYRTLNERTMQTNFNRQRAGLVDGGRGTEN